LVGSDREDNAVRPGRSDIAIPDLAPDLTWVGDPPMPMPQLSAAGPVLVHFLDFAQLNSVRALPYVLEWRRRYERAGLAVLGIQAPRFEFGADPQKVAAGLAMLGVQHPVAIDAERQVWLDYGCQGWPSLFLWGKGGALRWYHFGEGEYLATEEAIQEELRDADALRELPVPMDALRATDAPGAAVMPPTEEVFPGSEGSVAWKPGGEALEIDYEAGGAFATLDGKGIVSAALDEGEPYEVEVQGAGLYELAAHPRHESHRLRLEPARGEFELWSVSFSAGVP
jgi:hypothetical protein